MKNIKVKDNIYQLDDPDAALVEAIQELTQELKRLVNK